MYRQKPKTLMTWEIVNQMLILLVLLAVAACGAENTTPPAPTMNATSTTNATITADAAPAAAIAATPISFSKDVQPILNDRCVVCHQGQGPGQSNLTFEPTLSYNNLVGVASTENPAVMRVKAGAAGDSYIIAKLTGTQVAAGGGGARMPYQAAPLAESQINLINQWIKEGALNN